MLFRINVVLALLFQNAIFAEAQASCRLSRIGDVNEECGTLSVTVRTSLAGGRAAVIEEMPWHVGIYTKLVAPPMQVCGGSIVSARVVISAAHCFWSELAKQLPAGDYLVGAGKRYRPWNDRMDEHAQKTDVREIRIPPRFRGSTTSFQDDLALVIVASPFIINAYVQPVCLDFDYGLDKKHLTDGYLGKVAGWGRTDENGKPSPTLQVVNLPSVDIQRCFDTIEPAFRTYITSDKFCAGNDTAGTAVCMGDSGGGLSFPENSSSGMLFYLRGVVSTAPKSVNENLCNIFTFGTFTHIGKHEQFIREVMSEASGSMTEGTSPGSSTGVGAAEPLSVPSTPRQPPPDTPRNPKPFPFPEFKTGGKPKPLPKVSEDYTNDFFEPGTSRSDDATDVDYTVKVIEENLGTQTSPTTGTQPSDVDVNRTGEKPKPSDLFVPGTSRSDDATNVDYTVKVIDDKFGIQANPSIETQPGPSTGTQPAPSTGTQPGPSTGTQPGPSTGTQPGPSTATQPGPFTGTQPELSIETQPGPYTEERPYLSTASQPFLSILNQPIRSTGAQLDLSMRDAPGLSTLSWRSTQFTQSIPSTYTTQTNPDVTIVNHKWQSHSGSHDYPKYNYRQYPQHEYDQQHQRDYEHQHDHQHHNYYQHQPDYQQQHDYQHQHDQQHQRDYQDQRDYQHQNYYF